MYWLMLMIVAVAFTTFCICFKPTDEVYTLAIYSAGILSALWGFVIAPSGVQLVLEVLAFGWWRVSASHV